MWLSKSDCYYLMIVSRSTHFVKRYFDIFAHACHFADCSLTAIRGSATKATYWFDGFSFAATSTVVALEITSIRIKSPYVPAGSFFKSRFRRLSADFWFGGPLKISGGK